MRKSAMLRRVFILFLCVVMFLFVFSTGTALAKDPDPSQDTPYTFWESNPEVPGPPNAPFDHLPAQGSAGGSRWAYKDTSDIPGVTPGVYYPAGKLEGSYRDFQKNGTGKYTDNPHGGYVDTTNKCKMCHAVHRASGGFKLMRVDNPDEMCNYCHVGVHKHALTPAYTNNQVPPTGDIYTANGHTIDYIGGIPDSSINQWLEPKLVNGQTVNIRRYDPTKLSMYIFSFDYLGRLTRWGPTALFCKNCHQPHQATQLIWKPDGILGFKMLVASPSGSHNDPTKPYDYVGYWPVGYDFRIKVPEVSLSSATTGWPYTTYTVWKGPARPIDSRLESVWCADCHNLDIGYYEHVVSPLPSDSYHSDRTHSVPYATYDCYSCHRNNLTYYYTDNKVQATDQGSDFPHSGATTSTKLLKDTYDASYEHLDDICNDCHASVGVTQ